MDDTNMTARLAAHLNSKSAGPLVCPICKATASFEARGGTAGPLSEPRASIDPQFTRATCTECGYSIFFDTEALPPPA